MAVPKNFFQRLVSAVGGDTPSPSRERRRNRRATPTLDGLEDRVVLSQVASFHRHHGHAVASMSSTTAGTTSTTAGTTSTTTTNTALDTARQTLRNDIQKIEAASGTTIGQLTAIQVAFQTLSTDGLTPSSAAAISSFEDSLVTAKTSGTILTPNDTLLAQFEAIYTTSPTAQQTTDLTTAYNALAAAVNSSNITADNINTIIADEAAIQAAQGSTTTATFPYFTLVTGQAGGVGGGCHH